MIRKKEMDIARCASSTANGAALTGKRQGKGKQQGHGIERRLLLGLRRSTPAVANPVSSLLWISYIGVNYMFCSIQE